MKFLKQNLYIFITLLLVLASVKASTATGIKDYTPSPPIVITSNADFETYGFPGSGTEDNPYVIANYNITGSGVAGIYISESVDVYFIIENCYISGFDVGILISAINSPLIIIKDNFIAAKDIAINVVATYTMTYIFRNELSEAVTGIVIADTSVAIVNNTIHDTNVGISLVNIDVGLVLNNSINVFQHGISVDLEVQNTEICWNRITGFSDVAIGVDGDSSDKNIYYHHNTAIAGEPSGLYATYGLQYQANPNIYWYDPETNEGNYWSDWSSTDPYPIKDPQGNTVAEDLYPFISPPVPTGNFPELPSPPTSTTTETSTTSQLEQTESTEINTLTNPLSLNMVVPLVAILVLPLAKIYKRKNRN